MKQLKSIQRFLSHQKKIVSFILILIVITMLLIIILNVWLDRNGNRTLHSLGILRTTGVTVYGGDLTTCNGEVTCINWSTIQPGMSTNRSFYVQSKSNINTTLIITYGNWTFRDSDGQIITSNQTVTDLSTYMDLKCPQNETAIQPNTVIYVTLILSPEISLAFIEEIIVNDVQTFTFDTHIHTQA